MPAEKLPFQLDFDYSKISSFWIRRYYVLVVQNAVSKTRMKNCHNPKRTPEVTLTFIWNAARLADARHHHPKWKTLLYIPFSILHTLEVHNLDAWHRITTIDQKHRDKLPILVVLLHIAVVHKTWSRHKESRFKLGVSATASNQFHKPRLDATIMASSSDSNQDNPKGAPTLQGYLYIGVGILFLLTPILSLAFSYFMPQQSDGTLGYLHEYWNETGPFLRILTILPTTIVLCICHWVSFRIYLRRWCGLKK